MLELKKWAVIAHNDDTGFGRGALDLRAVLGIDRHLIIPSEKLTDKPKTGAYESFLDPGCTEEELRQALSGLQGVIFFERPNWHPSLLSTARELSIATVCIVTWEWFKGNDNIWDLCDLFVCPSEFSLSVVRKFGRQNSVQLPWALALSRFPPREISGPARLFVHNAGLVDPDDRKGTVDTIEAFKLTKRSDIRLAVRMQKEIELPRLDNRITVEVGNLKEPAELYRLGDVAIQPSKLEGIGFMILEAVASGMPVLTLDYPPMNEMVRQKELLIKKRLFARKSYGSVWVKQAHLRLPDLKDLAKKIEWCAQQDMSAFAAQNRAWAEKTFDRYALRGRWCAALNSLLERLKK